AIGSRSLWLGPCCGCFRWAFSIRLMPKRRPDLPTSICTSLPIFSPQRLRSALTRGLPTRWSCRVHPAPSEPCLCREVLANLNGWRGDRTVTVRPPASDSVKLFAVLHESAIGPKRTWISALHSARARSVSRFHLLPTTYVRF